MSSKLCCSLCLTPSNKHKSLQNNEGDLNDAYEITIKYFDPMFLITDNKADKHLCQSCWTPIEDFYKFQQNVIRTRSLLEKTLVKEEYNVQDNVICNDSFKTCDDGINHQYSYENVNVKPDLHLETDYKEQPFTINEDNYDDKPLIFLKSKSINETEVITQVKQEEIDYGNESINNKRRGIKRKQIQSESKPEDKPTDTDQGDTQRKQVKLNDRVKVDRKKSALFREKDREYNAFIAEWKPVLECDLCEETSCSYDKLRNHFKEKHKTKFYIKCCERKFYRRHLLVNHIQLHLNPETYKCDICGKVSTCKSNLKIHKKLMHEEYEQLECDICHKLFNQKPYLDRHLLTHVTGEKNFVCQECGKAYVLEIQLKSHIKTVHSVDRVCDQCGKTIHGIQALKQHLMQHAGIEKKKFPCDECGVILNSNSSLKRHKSALHHDGSTIYVCSICDKTFANPNALQNHKKLVHTTERKFKCTFCEKSFKTPKVLREHIATHTGQDLYQCPHCPQTFKVSANMHHHRKKVHPVEWEEGRKKRLHVPKVAFNQVKKQVVL